MERDFNTILQDAIKKDKHYGVWEPYPPGWKAQCNLCRRHLKEPEWCSIVMGRAIRGICPEHGKVEYSVD